MFMVTIKLPDKKKKEEYSLYINGNIVYKNTIKDKGTLIQITGTGIAFYSASNSRRAVIFQDIKEKDYLIPLQEGNLPYIREKVRVIYKVKGRKLDLLKLLIYNLEKKYSNEIYSFDIVYWLTVASFLDSFSFITNTIKNPKRHIFLLTDNYIKEKRRIKQYASK